ncbi:MAG: dihydropteroate synthase [Armatimonadetes bacterium JP3_11]|jgi:dihydropteroate synthase|nr:MAG: dihydropteroate synthase [Armatimonadetes bacterium CP1_7O]OYT75861.1 MAG: dihydropteroate synthase [Armatimonadetes bacterium JP3_11]RMH08148.1 MAG: dihydropteroate synthase [Armatimonadota bacterium]
MPTITERLRPIQDAIGQRTLVMGVLNTTPDSFYDGGRYATLDAALARAEQMLEEGADILDIGGESTRPGAEPVPEAEEIRRVVPLIEAIVARYPNAVISVDTTKSRVAQQALQAGACILNDISGATFDPRMLEVAAHTGALIVLMHIKGTPKTMQQNPVYDDVVAEVRATLHAHARRALEAGIPKEHIWLDPGIGFGKTVEHNLQLLRGLPELRTLDFPILVGTSRKSFIGHILGGLPPEERLEGTLATLALAVAWGADIVRVHDVKAAVRAVNVADALCRR